MTDQSFVLGVLALVVIVQAGCIAYCVKVLARERDHLLARNASDLARTAKARQPAAPPRVAPSPADMWAHDLAAEQMELMGDGEYRREVEPMVEGMNGL